MSVQLKSTKTKVRDLQRVREVLDSYKMTGVEIRLSEEETGGTLEMVFEDPDRDWYEWPLALHRDQWPCEEEYPDEDEQDEDELGETALDKLYEENVAQEQDFLWQKQLRYYWADDDIVEVR